MAFIPLPGTAQVEIVNTLHTPRTETVLHYTGGDATNLTALTNLAGAVNVLWQTHVAPLVTNQMLGQVVVATDMTQQFGFSVEVDNSTPGGIDNAVDPALPNSIALAVKKTTGLRGRSFRGRIYHYGLTESQVQSNQVEQSVADSILAAWTNFLTVTTADATWQMVVASRYENNLPRTTGVVTEVSTLTIVDNTVDNQRRRLPGRGQ